LRAFLRPASRTVKQQNAAPRNDHLPVLIDNLLAVKKSMYLESKGISTRIAQAMRAFFYLPLPTF
jgi:hypothetical protein